MPRTLYRGTIEYLTGTVSADMVITDSDTISVSFDRSAWYAAEWVGSTGQTRQWRLLVGADIELPSGSAHQVYLRVTDNPEVPVLQAGSLRIV